MSNNPLSSPKTMLGVAGAVVVMAVVASASLNGFVSSSDAPDPVEPEIIEAEMEPKSPEPQPTASAWADEGSADDWGVSGDDPSNVDGGWALAPGSAARGSTPDFGKFDPESTADDDESGDTSASPSQSERNNGSRGRGVIISGVAPGLSPARPPDI